MVFVGSLVPVKLAFEHLVGRKRVRLGCVGIVEILASAVKTVCRPEVSRLHIVVNRLHVNHLHTVEIDADLFHHRPGLLLLVSRGFRVGNALFAIHPHPFELLGEHRAVKLAGVVARKVTSLQHIHNLVRKLEEPLAVLDVLILDAVDCRSLLGDMDLPARLEIPRTDAPGAHFRNRIAGIHFHEAKLHYAVGRNVETGALDVEKQQRSCKLEFHCQKCLSYHHRHDDAEHLLLLLVLRRRQDQR